MIPGRKRSLKKLPRRVPERLAQPVGADSGCPDHELVGRQLCHARALAACSTELMASYGNDDANRAVLARAVEHLRLAADVDRVFIFRNFDDERVGPASAMLAEALAPNIVSHMPAHVVPILGDPHPEALDLSEMLPWSSVPLRNQKRLAAGHAVGGVLTELFAETPHFLARLHADTQPALSVQFFPIFCGQDWWGYAGFDDCQRPRIWDEAEVAILRAAAELFSSTLHRWQAEAAWREGESYQRGLAQFSHALLSNPNDPQHEREILNQALGHLVAATQASRAYVLRNFEDPELGLCCGIYAEACSAGVRPHINNPQNQRFPWSQLPPRMRLALAGGAAYGGPTEQTMAGAPHLLEAFRRQERPLLSIQTVPIHVNKAWWGFIGFDETLMARKWTEHEIMILQAAAEMLGSTLQRWQAEAQVIRAREELESRVTLRTAELSRRLDIESVLARIAARLLSTDQVTTAVGKSLADIGAMTRAQRVVLMQPAPDGDHGAASRLFLEWETHGAPLSSEQALGLWRAVPWLYAQLADHPVVTISDVRQVGPEGTVIAGLLGLDHAASLLLLALGERELPSGVLICANTSRSPDDPLHEVTSLKVVAGLLTGLLAREANLRTLEHQVADRTRELSVFLDIGLLVSEEHQLTESLELGLRKIIASIECDAGCIHTLDSDDGSQITLVAMQGLPSHQRAPLQDVSLSQTLTRWAAEANPPLLIGPSQSRSDLPLALRLVDFPYVLLAQLRAHGEVIGVLSCFARQDTELTINRISLAAAFGEQVGVILQNHRLQQQAEKLAVLNERQRLARELHDAVTQSLYSQTLFTRSAIDALEEGRLGDTRAYLGQLEINATQALREMRVLLHQLRPLELAHKTLAEAVEERLTLVERRVGIVAHAAIDDALALDEAREAALYRVIIEALNNTLRHAAASRVDVQLQHKPDGLILSIVDDGCGFDPEEASLGMGLNNMQERAVQLSGELRITSQPGRGTTLLLQIPPAHEPTPAGQRGGAAGNG